MIIFIFFIFSIFQTALLSMIIGNGIAYGKLLLWNGRVTEKMVIHVCNPLCQIAETISPNDARLSPYLSLNVT